MGGLHEHQVRRTILPATRYKLLAYLGEGVADVAIGRLTVTEERLKKADFVPGDDGRRTINEVVVTGSKSPEPKSLDDQVAPDEPQHKVRLACESGLRENLE